MSEPHRGEGTARFCSADELHAALQGLVERLEPDLIHAREAARLVERFGAMEKLCAAGKTLAARRVAGTDTWRGGGDRSAAHWMARTSGTTIGQAAATLDTAERVRELPATERALRSGALSGAQVGEIASAAAADPASEKNLLETAETEGLAGLRQQARKVKAAACGDEVARYERIRRERFLRHWTDHGGAFRLDASLTPDAGATVLAALEPHRERIFDQARKQGVRDRYDAYSADALVAMAQGSLDGPTDTNGNGDDKGNGDGKGQGTGTSKSKGRSGPRAAVHVLVDHAALVRGNTEAGETCEIAGVGPIPAATARALLSDSILAVVVTDGVDVYSVAHLGRTIPAHVRTALDVRDRHCVVPGCGVAQRLEIDHLVPIAEGGPTKLSNLARLCGYHHGLKSYKGWKLSGGPGAWQWHPPGRTHRDDVPAPEPSSDGADETDRAPSPTQPPLTLDLPPP